MKPFLLFFIVAMLCVSFSFAKEVDNIKKDASGFRENRGQLVDQNSNKRSDILYYGSSNNLTYYLKQDGISYQLYKQKENSEDITIQRIDIKWLGVNVNAKKEVSKAVGGFENFYNTPDEKEILNVKAFETVLYKNIYEGIDAKYYHQNGSLKYDYIVKPYADYKKIAFKIEGADKIVLNEDGTVTLRTPLGDIVEGKPVAYQEGKAINANWILEGNVLSFVVEEYDVSKELVIDPFVQAWIKAFGSYSGGTGGGAVHLQINTTVTDFWGNVYIGGLYDNIPGLGNPAVLYLTKYNANGIGLWSLPPANSPFGSIGDIVTFGTNIFIGGVTSSSNIAQQVRIKLRLMVNMMGFYKRWIRVELHYGEPTMVVAMWMNLLVFL